MRFNLFTDTKALCRVCMTGKEGHRTDLYDATLLVAGLPSLHGMLKAICATVFEKSDADYPPGMPTKVCAICRNAILAAFKLHQTCIESDRQLGELLALKWELQDLEGGDQETGVPLRSSNHKDGNLSKSVELEGENQSKQDSGSITAAHSGIQPENNLRLQEQLSDPEQSCDQKEDSSSVNEHAAMIKVEELNLMDESGNEGYDYDFIDEEVCSRDDNKNWEICEICSEKFKETSMLKNHMANRHQLYMCKICHNSFGSQFWYSKHEALHKKAKNPADIYPKPVSCSECGKKLANTARLRAHLRKNCLKLKYLSLTKREIAARTCKMCGKFHKKVRLLLKHIKEEHGKLNECRTCNESFLTEEALSKHRQIHAQPPHLCSICPKTYFSKSALKKHMIKHKAFACDLCPMRFFTQPELKNHIISHNKNKIAIPGQKFHKCRTCEEIFPTRKDLIKHRRVHQGAAICSICGKTLIDKSSLRIHMRRHSTKQYSCNKCPIRFYSKIELNYHMLSHTKIRNNICDICGLKFKKQNSLKRHVQLVHEGIRPYECHICGFKLCTTTQLKRHMLGHTGEKPYQCELCPSAFVQTNKLAYHVAREHRGGLPYPCDRCDESFRLLTDLRQHYRVHVEAGEQIDELRFTSMATLQRILAKDKQKLAEDDKESN